MTHGREQAAGKENKLIKALKGPTDRADAVPTKEAQKQKGVAPLITTSIQATVKHGAADGPPSFLPRACITSIYMLKHLADKKG